MTIKLELAWSRQESGGQFFVIGDVRDVIYSRAKKLFPLPKGISHGLGLLSTTGPSGAGEGILLRGMHSLTSPSSSAGSSLDPVPSYASLATPFFLGWSAEPLASGRLYGEEGSVSLQWVFEEVFAKIEDVGLHLPIPLVFIELAGLFTLPEIHDRSLRTSVHQGNLLITDDDQVPVYFNFGVIRRGLRETAEKEDTLIPLLVLGAGLQAQGQWAGEANLRACTFYQPPRSIVKDNERVFASSVITHNHALGWRGQPQLVQCLLSGREDHRWESRQQRLDEVLLPDILQRTADHLVHLDEWSRTQGGLLHVYTPRSQEELIFIR